MRVINAATPPEPIVDACRELASDPSAFAAEIAFIRILQGRLDEVEAVFDALPPKVREAKHVKIGRAGARALVALLRGDEAGAGMEVVRGEPELVVDEHEGGLRARLVPDEGDSEGWRDCMNEASYRAARSAWLDGATLEDVTCGAEIERAPELYELELNASEKEEARFWKGRAPADRCIEGALHDTRGIRSAERRMSSVPVRSREEAREPARGVKGT